MEYIKSYISRDLGTEGSLLIEKKIYGKLIEEADKALIPRSEAALYFGPGEIPGSSIDVDLTVENSMDVREVGEGAEIPLDSEKYTSFNMKPLKYGVAIRVTREMMEDGKWNLLDRNIKLAGKRMGENENALIVSDALDNATNTVAGGANITIGNITEGMQYLEDADYSCTSFFIGNEVLNDLRNIDTFAEADKFGNRDMLAKGFVGVLYGMNVIRVSSNAGITTTNAYITDKMHAYAIAEKRTITINNFKLETFDMEGATVTQRLKVRYLKADAICKITTT